MRETVVGRSLRYVALVAALMAATAGAQDTCDVTVQLEDTGPLPIVAFAVTYGGAGGDFVGDSTLPNFGPSWGTQFLACDVAVPVLEFTAIDDNAGSLSMFFAGAGLAGPVSLATCVFVPTGGFPCPTAGDFGIADATFPDDPIAPPFPLPSAPNVSITVSPRTPVCGDGFQEGTEECDDGNTLDADCCSSACTLDSAGTPCADASVCTTGETCDGTGTCVVGSEVVCDDGVFCTFDHCDDTLGCVADPVPNRTSTCEHWLGGRVDVRDASVATGDRLKLKLKVRLDAHEPNVGDPTVATDYAICLFDDVAGVGTLVDQIEIPAGAPWSGGAGDFRFSDQSQATEGIRKMIVKENGAASEMTVLMKATGANLTLPPPYDATRYFAQDSGVTVQLENDEGGCWWAYFEPGGSAIKNTVTKFKAKAK